jgi:Flp pilus assembly protein TadG
MLNAKPNIRITGRRGNVIVISAIMMTVLLGMTAMAVDMGNLYHARTQMQACADSAALAGAWELMDEDRLAGSPNMGDEIVNARNQVSAFAALNPVLNAAPAIDPNLANSLTGEFVVGYLNDPTDQSEALSTSGDPAQYNSVMVRVRRTAGSNGVIPTIFANIFGNSASELEATATATFKDGVTGFRATPETGNAGLMPFALHVDSWNDLLAGAVSTGDNYEYDESSGVSSGSDNILELNLYPGAGVSQLPPGNFGTVDIGSSNNSTAVLSRQIRYGVTEADLAFHGGELSLGSSGSFQLNGDTGLSAAIKSDLEAIIGEPRTILLFNTVTGNGNNSMYTIVGFAGIRVLNVKLTGSMSSKEVIIQPAYVVDDSAMTGPGSGSSYFVMKPVFLSR